jgi:hypothetical protein
MNALRADEMTFARESLFLIAICTADLISTLLLIGGGGAVEGNPLMGFYLRYGIGTFVMVKLSLIFLPIFIAEWGKRYRPRFVRALLRATIVAYLGMYLLVFVMVNVGGAVATEGPLYLPPTHATSTK